MRRRLVALPLLVSVLVVAPSVARAAAPVQVGFASSAVSTGGLAWGTTVADVTSDGRSDLVVTTHGPASDPSIGRDLLVFAQQPDGSLGPTPAVYPVAEATGPDSLLVPAVGDFSGDGIPDVVVGHEAGFDVFVQSGGVLATGVPFPTSGPVHDLHVADLNGDGRDDVVFSVALTATAYRYAYQLQRADHSFGNGVQIAQGAGASVAVGDVNGDGTTDVVAEDPAAPNVRIFLNDGAAVPAFTEADDARAGGVVSASVGDVTGDARNDVVLLTSAGIQVFAGLPDGSFADPVTTGGVLANATTLRTVDMNGDGANDVVVTAPSGTQVFLQSAGTLAAPCPFPSTTPAPTGGDATVAVGDLNGDGRPDVAGAQDADAVRLLTQVAPGTRTASSVTAQVVPSAIELDAGVTVSGELTLGSGGCLDLGTVEVWRDDGAGAQKIGDATLTFVDQGTTYAYSFDDVPPSIGTSAYHVVFAQDTWHEGATSSDTSVVVGPKTSTLTLTSKDAEVAAGGTTTLTGHLVGPPAGSTVEFFSVASGVRSLVGSAPTNAQLNARVVVTISKQTRFVATFAGDGTWKPATSDTITVALARQTSSLSLKTAAGVIDFGKGTTLTATLKGGSGTRKIHFLRVVDGTRKLLGTVTANAKGIATFKVAPGVNSIYVATYDGNAAWLPATSAKVAVKVRVVVTNRTTDYSVKEGSVAVYDCCRGYLFIKVAPVHAGKKVNVYVEFSTPSGWKALGKQSFTLKKDGSVKIYLDVAGGSGYRFRTQACFPSDSDHVGACGPWVGFRFR